MYDVNLEKLLEDTKRELQQAIKERDTLNIRIVKLQGDLKALHRLIFRDVLANNARREQEAVVGLTDAIRSIINIKAVPLKAAEVKSALELMGFDLTGFSNPSAAVHN